MNIKYTDNSGDLISVKNDEEFQSMLRDHTKGAVIRLHLTRRHREAAQSVEDVGGAALEAMLNPVIVIDGVWMVGASYFYNTLN